MGAWPGHHVPRMVRFHNARTEDGRFARSSQNASPSNRADTSGGSTVLLGAARAREPASRGQAGPGLRRRVRPRPARPAASSAVEAGSGTAVAAETKSMLT